MEHADAVDVAAKLAAALDEHQQEYALGGAIALGYWATPRGTVDVDVTLFLPKDKPSTCVWLLQDLGCTMSVPDTLGSLREHGFCRVQLGGVRVDVFLPITDFYDAAKARRRTVVMGNQTVQIWDAETLIVFKLMFFRRKDLGDIEQILRNQGTALDFAWIDDQLTRTFGQNDPRILQWRELRSDVGL